VKIRSHRELNIYKKSFAVAMEIFQLSKHFPKEEMYSLTDQVRRSSRSVAANISEAFRKRQYPRSFVAKLIDSECEAAETQTWLDFALECQYLTKETANRLSLELDEIMAMALHMKLNPDQWKP
jgi:four helix bundle protein